MVQVMRRGEILANDIEDTSNHDQEDNQSTCSNHHQSALTQNISEEFNILHTDQVETSVIIENTREKNAKNLYNSNFVTNSVTPPNNQEITDTKCDGTSTKINEQTNNPKECNDFSESTSTLTINPEAALSEDFLAPTISYDVSSLNTVKPGINYGNRFNYCKEKIYYNICSTIYTTNLIHFCAPRLCNMYVKYLILMYIGMYNKECCICEEKCNVVSDFYNGILSELLVCVVMDCAKRSLRCIITLNKCCRRGHVPFKYMARMNNTCFI